MNILSACILKLILISFVNSGSVPCAICGYAINAIKNNPFTFVATDIPEVCDAVQISTFYLNKPISDSDPIVTDIASAVKVVEGKKQIFINVDFLGTTEFPAMIDSNDTSAYDRLIVPMLTFVQKNKVNGIIIDSLQLFGGTIANYATKLNDFISKMKETIPSLIVGIVVNGWKFSLFSNTTLFDFSVANDKVDMYVITVKPCGIRCDINAYKTGLLPWTYTDDSVVALDDVCYATKNSAMEQSKVLIKFLLSVQYIKTGQKEEEATSYTAYCKMRASNKLDSTTVYCADSIEHVSERAKYAIEYFKGIMLSDLDYDDSDESCECGKFPVANAFINGFENKKITHCNGIS